MPGVSKDVTSIMIDDSVKDLVGHLVIRDYPNLETVTICCCRHDSILSLTIENNPLLKSIVMEVAFMDYLKKIVLSSLFFCL